MKILLQRVTEAEVTVAGDSVGKIGKGILALVGIEPHDTEVLVERGIEKLLNYRIFSDDAGKMNLSLRAIKGELLLVSQFTLAAHTQKGLRPSFTSAAPPEMGERLFQYGVSIARQHQAQGEIAQVATGQFGADMQVSLINDGPVTFLLEF